MLAHIYIHSLNPDSSCLSCVAEGFVSLDRVRAEEMMAQWEKYLLCKCEDLHSDTKILCKTPCSVVCAHKPRVEGL